MNEQNAKLLSELKEIKEKKVLPFNILRYGPSDSNSFCTYPYTHTIATYCETFSIYFEF